MKRVVIAYSFLAASTLMLAGCDKSKDIDGNNQINHEGTTHVTKRIKTDSGLEYEIIQEGTGESPKRGQAVTVHYTGYLNDNGERGKKFDSSVDRGQPFEFNIGVGQVIRGWDEGVLSMKVGEKRCLIIPAELGYGSRGAGALIPANASLIFDVELIKVR